MKAKGLSVIYFILIIFSLTATNRYVPNDYQTIQAALNLSANGDTVFVAPGTYVENIIWPQVDGIALISTGTRLNTVIDANHSGRGISFVCSWTNPAITSATKVKGFSINNGFSNLNGAGVICYYASPEFYNCIIAYNECSQSSPGGGLYCHNASPHFNDVIIAYNKAYSGGGAHIDTNSSPIFNNCVFADNTLIPVGSSFAAGIYGINNVQYQLNNCTVVRNIYDIASAIRCDASCIPVIRHSNITDNVNGIVIMHNGGLNMQDCHITNNLYDGLWHNDNDGDTITAQNNWWGYDTGPYHDTLNPQGEGNSVIGLVNFQPWLLLPDSTTPPAPPTGIGAFYITNNSFTINWSANPESDISYYVINYGTDSLSVIHSNNITTNEYSYNLVNLTPHTNYAIQIAAVNTSNVQSWFSKQLVVYTSNVSNSEFVAKPVPVIINCYPNPTFNSTRIKYETKSFCNASMSIYNIKGECVKQLFKNKRVSGIFEVTWDGRNVRNEAVSAGLYFVRLESDANISYSKLVLIK